MLKQSFKAVLLTCSVLTLASCNTNDGHKEAMFADVNGQTRTLKQILAENQDSPSKKIINEAAIALSKGDHKTASEKLNVALIEDPTNSWLHHLNGLAYQLKAEKGDFEAYELAAAGFQQALKFDASNAQASIQLGRVRAKQKKYREAQDEFANALIIDPTNVEALYELASSSYFAGDLKTAQVAINRVLKQYPSRPEALKAASLINAAVGRGELALAHLAKYRAVTKNEGKAGRLEGRVHDWDRLHKSGVIMLANGDDVPPAVPPKQAVPKGKEDMVVVDAIVMRVSEDGTTTKGSNILDGFSVTLAPGTHLYSRASIRAVPGADFSSSVFSGSGNFPGSSITAGSALSVSKLFTQGVSFGNVSYSLNIANAKRTHLEVVGRPSLVASKTKKAKFFSGQELTIGLAGENGGNISKFPVGVTLEVTPTAIEGDLVTLDIKIYGSVINEADLFAGQNQQSTSVRDNFTKVGLSKVETSVQVKFGETIMLGGVTERIDTHDKDGFPILQDIPIIQYLFSQETTASERKSVMYLIRPLRYTDNKRATKEFFANGAQYYNLTELEKRNKDWYAPEYNTRITLDHLASLHREFRTGDMDPLYWHMQDHLEQQTTQALSFLYY